MDDGKKQEFGIAFNELMSRLIEETGALARTSSLGAEHEHALEEVRLRYTREADRLAARYLVPSTVAEYVRHVVREGFEVEFDPMDPALPRPVQGKDDSAARGHGSTG